MEALPFKPRVLVEITKVAVANSPVTEASSWEQWIPGAINPKSLPVDYTLRGFLLEEIREDGQIRIIRTHRNGIQAFGEFESTPIVAIHPNGLVETFNSFYRVELVNE